MVFKIILSSIEFFLSAWASGVDIFIHAVKDSAMAKNMNSSVWLPELKSQLF